MYCIFLENIVTLHSQTTKSCQLARAAAFLFVCKNGIKQRISEKQSLPISFHRYIYN